MKKEETKVETVNYYGEKIEIKNQKDFIKDIIRKEKNDQLTIWAITHPNCPPEILAEVLKRGNNDEISRNAASHPNCPPEALVHVLKRCDDDLVSYFESKNKKFMNLDIPEYVLAQIIMRDDSDWISVRAAKNPNCPLKAKIEWMKQVGIIAKEDPNIHFIQNINEPKIDEDLQKLKNLIGE